MAITNWIGFDMTDNKNINDIDFKKMAEILQKVKTQNLDTSCKQVSYLDMVVKLMNIQNKTLH